MSDKISVRLRRGRLEIHPLLPWDFFTQRAHWCSPALGRKLRFFARWSPQRGFKHLNDMRIVSQKLSGSQEIQVDSAMSSTIQSFNSCTVSLQKSLHTDHAHSVWERRELPKTVNSGRQRGSLGTILEPGLLPKSWFSGPIWLIPLLHVKYTHLLLGSQEAPSIMVSSHSLMSNHWIQVH